MGRLKKRVQRRLKKQVKQSIKKPKTQAKTPEQQAKENEMLKVMLSRQPQLIAGQGEKNDKLQQQLDLQKNVLIQKQKEFQNTQDLLNQYKTEMEKMKADINQAKAKRVNEEKINKEKEKGIREKEKEVVKFEKEEKRGRDLMDKEEALEEKKRAFDAKTVEGEHKKKMTELEGKEREYRRKIAENEKEIRDNTLFAELKAKKDELDILTAQIASQDEILNSEEYKKRKEKLIEVNKNLFEAKEKLAHNEQIRKIQAETEILEATKLGQERYLGELKKKVPQQDSIFLESTTIQNQKQLAEQLLQNQKAKAENERLKEEIEMRENLHKQVKKLKWENDTVEKENETLNKYVESKDYKSKINLIETEKQLEEQRKTQLDFQKQSIQAKRKIQQLEAQLEIGEQYDPTKTDLAGVQAQIQELSKIGNETFENNNTIIQNNINLNKQKAAYDAAYDNLLNRYDNKKDKDSATNNLMLLMEEKIGSKLPKNTNDWDIKNLERATAFTEMIGKLTPDLLLKPDMLNDFVKGEEFNNFNWNIV